MFTIRHDVYVHFDPQPPETSAILARLLETQEILMTTQAQTLAILTDVKAKLSEASTELTAKIAELTAAIAAAGNNTPEVDAALADVTAIATSLADVVPNA